MIVPPLPPSKLVAVAPDLRSKILADLRSEVASAEALEWAEKLRRFAGLYANSLESTGRRRFGADSRAMLEWMFDVLLAASGYPDAGPVHAAFLNGALTLEPHLSQERRAGAAASLVEKVTQFSAWHTEGSSLAALPVSAPSLEHCAGRWRTEAATQPSIVILSPSPYSLLTLAVIGIFVRLSIPIAGLLVRRFTLQRLASEYRRDGVRLAYKVWRKLIVRGDENPDATDVSLKRVADVVTDGHTNALAWCKKLSVPVMSAADFDAPEVLDWLRRINPNLGVFTGGGLVSTAVQSEFRNGIINPHMGHLPYYRGMDVVQWPILEGRLDNVGVTAHLMDAGLDTGPVIQTLRVDPRRYRTIGALRNVISGLMPLMLVDSALGLTSGRLHPAPQTDVHPQYYYVHERLLSVLDDRLRASTQSSSEDSTKWFAPWLNELAR
jgi:folate-dependent phosphoribosylglycinamide formyltransferase PurN